MTDEPTLKQFNFLKGKGKWVEGMTKQDAHAEIARIIPPAIAPKTPMAEIVSNEQGEIVDIVPMNPEEKPKKSYELTDGNIRIGALTCAIDQIGYGDSANLWSLVKEFEEYIRNGK